MHREIVLHTSIVSSNLNQAVYTKPELLAAVINMQKREDARVNADARVAIPNVLKGMNAYKKDIADHIATSRRRNQVLLYQLQQLRVELRALIASCMEIMYCLQLRRL